MTRLGFLPDVSSIINTDHSGENKNQWHNFLTAVQQSIEIGQPVGTPNPVGTGGMILPQCIRSSIFRVISNTSVGVELTTAPAISDGFDGQELTLEGSDNIKTVTLHNGNGLQLQGGHSITLKNGDIIKLHYNNFRKVWIENYRSINS